VVTEVYFPRQGDIIRLNFDPQSGHEQKGWRPGLVISNSAFNRASGFAVVCPITSTNRKYPFHISIPEGSRVSGVVMVDQVKSLDYLARKVRCLGRVDRDFLEEILAIHRAIYQTAPYPPKP
jgi:mRNA interferase MazF